MPPSSSSSDTPPPTQVTPMSRAHVMDWAALDLGHPTASKRTVHLADLDVHVWGIDEIEGGTLPIGLIIVAHGWANKARDMEPMASGLIGEINALARAGGRRRTRDVLVATLDQRNHGDRRRIRDRRTWQQNPGRFLDNVASVSGGKQDHQFIIDLLPSFIYPRDERVVDEFMCAGFSMGGHVTWRMLREDPRVRIAVPICSLPSEAMGRNLVADATSGRFGDVESWLPAAIRHYYTAPPAPDAYRGKKILALHGGLDAVVAPDNGLDVFYAIRDAAPEGEVDRWVQEDRGHVVSEEMVGRAAEWFWRWGLSEA